MKELPSSFKREDQTLSGMRKYTENYDLYDLIRIGFFKNTLPYPSEPQMKKCEHCGSRYQDQNELQKAKDQRSEYHQEENRLYKLFRDALFDYFNLNPNQKAHKAFELAWSKGHANGMAEVYNEFSPLVDLL